MSRLLRHLWAANILTYLGGSIQLHFVSELTEISNLTGRCYRYSPHGGKSQVERKTISIMKACEQAENAAQCERALEKDQIRQFPGVASREGGASLNVLSGMTAGNFSAYWMGMIFVALMGIAYWVTLLDAHTAAGATAMIAPVNDRPG